MFLDKKTLYVLVSNMKNTYNISLDAVGLNIKKIIADVYGKSLSIDYNAFESNKLGGLLFKGKNKHKIVLNKQRSEEQQNFDLCHEFIHLDNHSIANGLFKCVDNKYIQQNKFIEWQANEGAAEFLVPYKVFIPAYVNLSRKYIHSFDVYDNLAKLFNVSPGVIDIRLKSLEYEIRQYLDGIPLEEINIVAKTRLEKANYRFESPYKTYCTTCRATVENDARFCYCCGKKIRGLIFFAKAEGVGYMSYDALDQTKCPVCKNTDIDFKKHDYCCICGQYIKNACTNRECGNILPPYARYCYDCGEQTTYFENNFLKDHNGKFLKDAVSELKPLDNEDLPF